MENTEHLRAWINSQIEAHFDGNRSAFAENTAVSRQTWLNIISGKYQSLRQQAVTDLCTLFEISEIDLYRIAHPEMGVGALKEATPTYKSKDDPERLAAYLRRASKKDREFIYNAAERCGFKRIRKQDS